MIFCKSFAFYVGLVKKWLRYVECTNSCSMFFQVVWIGVREIWFQFCGRSLLAGGTTNRNSEIVQKEFKRARTNLSLYGCLPYAKNNLRVWTCLNMLTYFRYIHSIVHYIDAYCRPKQWKSPNIFAFTRYIASIFHDNDAHCRPKHSNIPNVYDYSNYIPWIFHYFDAHCKPKQLRCPNV